MSKTIPKVQRALVLQGGGGLAAYEVGVLKTLFAVLNKEDKENNEENKLLFDIIAGSSIGAMNGAILTGQFLKNKNWQKAIDELETFWKEGLACIPNQDMSTFPWWQPWKEKWNENIKGLASEEAARRYYSVKNFGASNVYQLSKSLPDVKFFDNELNKWFVFTIEPLKSKIKDFSGTLPISTSFEEDQLRLLIFAVDVAEGEMVTFDSYPKQDGLRKSEYGKYDQENKKFNHVIKYDGVTIEHIMASGTIPEIFEYAEIPLDQTKQDTNINKKQYTSHFSEVSNKTRYFWDSGILNNTPLRETLQAHQDYWRGAERIPDLDIFIVNVHPSKMDLDKIPKDFDGVKNRHNDIKYGDRYSHYDETISYLLTDYRNFVTQMRDFIRNFIDNDISNEDLRISLNKKFDNLLNTNTNIGNHNDGKNDYIRRYKDLIQYGFNLNEVIRIEHTNYIDSIYGKGSDFTYESICKLIKAGRFDSWISLIRTNITKMKLVSKNIETVANNLLERVDRIESDLKTLDYIDKNEVSSQVIEFNNELNDKSKQIREVSGYMFFKIKELAEGLKDVISKETIS